MLLSKTSNAVNTKWRFIGLAGKTLIDLLFNWSPIEVRGRQRIQPLFDSGRWIGVFWHSRILLVSYAHKGFGASIMVSNSDDGEIIAQILQRQGQSTIRGSTNKGGMRALVQIKKNMQSSQKPAAVVPDGPQGPRHKVQPGVIVLAKNTGLPILPITYSAKHRKVFDSWDRFILPLPATPCIIKYGRPIKVRTGAGQNWLGHYTTEVENELNRITAEADAHFGHRFKV